MRRPRRDDPLAIPAAVALTVLCIAVVVSFIVSRDPTWLIADAAAIFALGIGMLWYHVRH